MDMNKVSSYKNKIADFEAKDKKVNESKITLKAQIEQSEKLKGEKIEELKVLGVDYANKDAYVANKTTEIEKLEQKIESILNGEEDITENTTATVDKDPYEDYDLNFEEKKVDNVGTSSDTLNIPF